MRLGMPKGRLAHRCWRKPRLGADLLPLHDEECRCGEFCITSVWSTPKNPSSHGRALRRVVDNCTTHRKQLAADGAEE